MADALGEAQIGEFLGNVRVLIKRAVSGLPTHEDFIARHFAAG